VINFSHIYVIAFEGGTVKVGRAADVAGRLATHRRTAACFGLGVTAEWHSPRCGYRMSAQYERQLVEFCASRGVLRGGQEYFTGVEFSDVQRFAESLIEATNRRTCSYSEGGYEF
jgi:hypothetical protein